MKTSVSIGDIIYDRYMVKKHLGEGGFSTVYLVEDQDIVSEGALFALKELRSQDEQERVRFAFEGEVLKRLSHRALPRIYGIIEDGQQAFMLLGYIAGPNLEILRRKQPRKRFSLTQTMSMIKPIMDAATYLHAQQPPIIHRDIKPANIIFSETDERTVLVDFGIAKEYDRDATTTAVRHCSPGYGAPEQYSNLGTDPRTDIYGLGATCYALLTGTIPTDALQRVTALADGQADPLVAINTFVPDIPWHVAQAIHRAMSIGYEKRFATVEEFWQALNTYVDPQKPQPSTRPSAITTETRYSRRAAKHTTGPVDAPRVRKRAPVLPVLVTLAAVILAVLGFLFYTTGGHPGFLATRPALSHQQSTAIPTGTSPSLYPHLAGTYNGVAGDLNGKKTSISLTKIQQTAESISGNFSGLNRTSTFKGVLDTSQHVLFTVSGTNGHTPLFFDGTVESDGKLLVGSYCDVDQAGACVGNSGVWNVVPASP